MTLTLSGTGASTVFAPGAKVQPFKNIRVLDSLQDQSKVGTLNFTFTVTDINGGSPTDAAGTFALGASGFRQIAPGTYTLTRSASGVVNNAVSYLKALTFTAGQTPSTAVITIAATDNLNQAGTDTLTQIVTAVPPTKFLVTDTLANNNYTVAGTAYTGPGGVNNQYVVQTDNPALSATNLNITALAPGVFIHTGSGVDAINVAGVGGRNILDGGTNSNFLTGGAAGSGADTFFVDARNAAADIWNTVVNFHAGDAVTLFGITPTNKAINWADGQGTTGATGLTLHATQAGAPQASFTLAGYTTADLSNGRLATVYGVEPDGTPYLYVAGLK